MSLPSVNNTVLDGQLATVPFKAGQTPIIIGASSAGTVNTVKAYAGNQENQIVTDWGYGPMPQQAARLSAKGIAVAVCKSTASTAGAQSAVTTGATNTSTSAVTTTGNAFDTYHHVVVQVVTGCTIGVAGGSIKVSFDNSETFAIPQTALGTGNTFAIANTGISLAFAAGTLVAGDTFTFTTTEPKWSATDLNNALTAASASGIPWDFPHIVGSMNSTEAATLKTWLTGLETSKRFTRAFAETVRMASSADWSSANDATWQAVLIADYATFTSKRIAIGAGDVRWVSAIDQSVYLRPVAWLACEMAGSFDPARYELGRVKDDGAGTGALDCSLFDPNGNAIGHNEMNFPGLYEPLIAAIGFMVARTIPSKGKAVYLAKAKLFSPVGSDFQTFRLGRVMDIAETSTNDFLTNEIQETPPVTTAGTILPTYAEKLEMQGQQRLDADLLTPFRASATTFSVHRNENLLSGPNKGTVNVDVRIIPRPTVDTVGVVLGFTASLPTA